MVFGQCRKVGNVGFFKSLPTVKDPQQKAELYACLWMMMNEETLRRERNSLYCTGKRRNLPSLSITDGNTAPDKVTYRKYVLIDMIFYTKWFTKSYT